MKIRTLLVDDERLARKQLRELLKSHPEIEVVGEAANAEEGIEFVKNEQPDLIFLDIQMPGKNGFEMLEELHSVPRVIFVTAYDEYAIKAFEVNALDYLLKPVEQERLQTALDKITPTEQKPETDGEAKEILGDEDRIFLKDGEKCWFVPLKDIRLFQAEGNYIRVLFNDNKPLILKSLNNLEERLDPKSFFRASRKAIINLKWVNSIDNWFNGRMQVTLKEGETVEISRRQSARFKELMSL